jgi:mono/diheme cytochrome c family protein
MTQRWKRWLSRLAIVVAVAALGGAAFALFQAAAFDASVDKVYAIAPLDIQAMNDPAVIARGKHLVQSHGGCLECHGHDLGGKPSEDLGLIGVVPAPNLTTGKGGVLGRCDPRSSRQSPGAGEPDTARERARGGQ